MLRYFDSFNYYLVTEVITNPHLPAAVHILTCYWWPPHRTSNCRSTFFIFRVLCMATPAGLEPATSCVTGMRSSQLNYGAVTSQVAAWLSLRSDILKYYRQIIYLSNQNNFFSELQDQRFPPARESNPPHFQLRSYPILCFSLGFEHKGNNCFPGDPGGD